MKVKVLLDLNPNIGILLSLGKQYMNIQLAANTSIALSGNTEERERENQKTNPSRAFRIAFRLRL